MTTCNLFQLGRRLVIFTLIGCFFGISGHAEVPRKKKIKCIVEIGTRDNFFLNLVGWPSPQFNILGVTGQYPPYYYPYAEWPYAYLSAYMNVEFEEGVRTLITSSNATIPWEDPDFANTFRYFVVISPAPCTPAIVATIEADDIDPYLGVLLNTPSYVTVRLKPIASEGTGPTAPQ